MASVLLLLLPQPRGKRVPVRRDCEREGGRTARCALIGRSGASDTSVGQCAGSQDQRPMARFAQIFLHHSTSAPFICTSVHPGT